MTDWKIPLFKIYTDENDVNAVTNIIQSGMDWATGPKISELESCVANYVGSKYAVAVSSGTAALHIALLAHNIGPGDEVIVPSFTFIATANAPRFVGAKPVFADIDIETYGLNPFDVECKITPSTKAIIPVHVAGRPCNIKELKEVADRYDLLLIEDAAGALGARVEGGKCAGTYGDMGVFSFCASKVVTAGEGGIIVTDSQELYEQMKLIRSHGRADTQNYFTSNEYMDYIQLGYNFRMSNITAALALSQMYKIDDMIAMRRKNAQYLTCRLEEIEGISTQVDVPNHTYQMYMVLVKERDGLMKHLTNYGIMSKVYYPLVHKTTYYQKTQDQLQYLPITEVMSELTLTLPMYPTLKKKEIDYMVECIEDFLF